MASGQNSDSIILPNKVDDLQVNPYDTNGLNSNLEDVLVLTRSVPLYTIDSCMFDILKRIVGFQKGCISYVDSLSCFYLGIHKKADFYRISIVSSKSQTYDCSDCVGAFLFENIVFICIGDITNELFHKLDSNFIKITDIRDYTDFGSYPDETFSEWVLSYNKKQVKMWYERICGGRKY
jgi:hypothetical protein